MYKFSCYPRDICLLSLSVSKDPIPRVSNSESTILVSVSWPFPSWAIGKNVYVYLYIVVIRFQTAQAVSSLKEILIFLISRWLLKELWFYSYYNFSKTMTSYASYKLLAFSHPFWSSPSAHPIFIRYFQGLGNRMHFFADNRLFSYQSLTICSFTPSLSAIKPAWKNHSSVTNFWMSSLVYLQGLPEAFCLLTFFHTSLWPEMRE